MGGRGCCAGLGEFLTFSAMVLMILVNIGQISQNVVARNFYLASADLRGVQNAAAGQTAVSTANLFASDQSSALFTNAGLRYNYYWGMYSECGGDGINGARACSANRFGNRFEPLPVLNGDAPQGLDVSTLLPQGTIQDTSYLSRFSNAAFWLLFVGTILAGVAFLVGVLSHRFAFLFAALLSLGAAACLAVGAAIWTALVNRTRASIADNNVGIAVYYGHSIWMAWASFAACALAFPFLVISCCTGRDKY